MLSPENRALVTAFVAILVGLVLFVSLEPTIGIPDGWDALLGFFLFAVVGFALPQLYLVRTDESAAPLTRRPVVVVVTLVLATGFSANATGTERDGIWAATIVITLVIVVREFREGYLVSHLDSQ